MRTRTKENFELLRKIEIKNKRKIEITNKRKFEIINKKRNNINHFTSKNLVTISIHCCVRQQNLWLDQTFWLTNAEAFLEHKTIAELRVFERATSLFDDVNRIEIGAAVETKNSVDAQTSKVLFVLVHNLGRESGASNGQQILL